MPANKAASPNRADNDGSGKEKDIFLQQTGRETTVYPMGTRGQSGVAVDGNCRLFMLLETAGSADGHFRGRQRIAQGMDQQRCGKLRYFSMRAT
jgi:hypothetical protein